MVVSREQARRDLGKMISAFETFGDGAVEDRAAQLVMQSMDVLRGRLNNSQVIKMLYLDNSAGKDLLPDSVYSVVLHYSSGRINESTAREMLDVLSMEYRKIFKEMGIKPKVSPIVFPKPF